jgi:peptidoglycan hydrolase-like protein with peptidoglycan-binding domain
MNCPTVKLSSQSPCVSYLQKLLNAYRTGVDKIQVNGRFDLETRNAVREFQRSYGLAQDGVVGRLTWTELVRHGFDVKLPPLDHDHASEYLKGFIGDADWIHEWEGHVGWPYWPGGKSGITLDPGFDIAYVKPALLEQVWRPRLSPSQMDAILAATRYKGRAANNHLKSADGATLRSIRVSRSEAKDIFPVLLDPYWNDLTERFPALLNPSIYKLDTLEAACHTAFLSLGFNRGTGNPALRVLREPLEQGKLSVVGNLIASMQQDHELYGIRRRRRAEGMLILDLL